MASEKMLLPKNVPRSAGKPNVSQTFGQAQNGVRTPYKGFKGPFAQASDNFVRRWRPSYLVQMFDRQPQGDAFDRNKKLEH